MTTKTTKPPRPIDAARLALDKAITDEQGWQQALDAATAELERLEAASPATPADVAQLADKLTTAREQAALLERGIDRAQQATSTARTAVLAAEADEMQSTINVADKAVTAHRQRTSELLAPLAEHTGAAAERWQIDGWDPGSDPAGHALEATAAKLRRRQQALQVAAEGGDPTSLLPLEDLPDSLQIGGIAPCAAAIAQAHLDAEAEAARLEREAEQAQLDAAWKILNPARRTNLDRTGQTSRIDDQSPEVTAPYERPSERWLHDIARKVRTLHGDDIADALITVGSLTWPELANDLAGELTRQPEPVRFNPIG